MAPQCQSVNGGRVVQPCNREREGPVSTSVYMYMSGHVSLCLCSYVAGQAVSRCTGMWGVGGWGGHVTSPSRSSAHHRY